METELDVLNKKINALNDECNKIVERVKNGEISFKELCENQSKYKVCDIRFLQLAHTERMGDVVHLYVLFQNNKDVGFTLPLKDVEIL